MELTREELLAVYRWLLLTRRTDEKVCEIYARQGLPELPHSSQGEEAIAVGCTFGLRKDDFILPSLRARGMFYVKGISSRKMMAGMFGKIDGPTGSIGTSHHMGSIRDGVLAGTGAIGSGIPLAVGSAWGLKQQGKDSVVVTTFGDGATSRGDFHEALNLAAVWKLPVVLICENNGLAISTPVTKQTAAASIAERAAGYGMPGVTVDGNEVLAVYRATQEAVARARKGEGPTLIECKTNRWRGHSENDRDSYRNQEELAKIKEDCPVRRFQDYLLSKGLVDGQLIAEIEASVREEVEDAVQFAINSPWPAPEEVKYKVFCEGGH